MEEIDMRVRPPAIIVATLAALLASGCGNRNPDTRSPATEEPTLPPAPGVEKIEESGVEVNRLSTDDPQAWVHGWVNNLEAAIKAPDIAVPVFLDHMYQDPEGPYRLALMQDRERLAGQDFDYHPTLVEEDTQFSDSKTRVVVAWVTRRDDSQLAQQDLLRFTVTPRQYEGEDGTTFEWLVEDIQLLESNTP